MQTEFHAIVLGIIQGLTEFLPVSSSAHLTLTPWLFGWSDPGLAFDVALHLGSLVALLVYYRRAWETDITGAEGRGRGRRRPPGHLIPASRPRSLLPLSLAKRT